MTMTTDNENIFDGFEVDEIIGFVLDQDGPEGLRGLLDTIVADQPERFYQNVLLDAADKLEKAGLLDGADIIRAAIEPLKDQVDPEIIRIVDDTNAANVKSRLRSYYARHEFTPADVECLRENCGEDVLAFVFEGATRRVIGRP
jgi:hypothetical protein